MLNLKVSELEDKLKNEITAHKGVELSLVERNTMNKELENRVRLLSAECDALKKSGAGSEVSCLCFVFLLLKVLYINNTGVLTFPREVHVL